MIRLPASSARQSGFTLLELLVVLAIMGFLAAIVGPQVMKYVGSSRSQTAKVQIDNIVTALNHYRLDVGSYPTEQEGLEALVRPAGEAELWNGPYLSDPSGLIDPWSVPYKYRIPGQRGGEIDVYTLGADKVEGGSQDARDVGNWK